MEEAKICKIEEFAASHPDDWEGFGAGRTVREYFSEYSYIPDLYERLCSDFDIRMS